MRTDGIYASFLDPEGTPMKVSEETDVVDWASKRKTALFIFLQQFGRKLFIFSGKLSFALVHR